MVASVRRRAKHGTVLVESRKQWLVDIPLEVLIEIFLFLEPLDLLYLARVTKGLREFLLSRNKCSALWKNVIGNVDGLPPCPDHMSAPAYIHLAFVPVCHGCFGPCETIEWELRMRCCSNCFLHMTMYRNSVFDTAHGYLSDVDLPISRNHCELNIGRGFDITATVHITSPYRSLSRSDWEVAKSRKKPKHVSMVDFIAAENEYWGSIRKYARACQDWELGVLRLKAARLSLVRRQRLEDIKAKLRQLGWKESDLSLHCGDSFLHLPEVRKLEPLTSPEWTKIRPRVVSWLEDTKEKLVWDTRIDLYDLTFANTQRELKDDTLLKVRPLRTDIALFPPVRAMMEGSIHSDMSHDDFRKKLLRALPQAIRKWSVNAVEELEECARQQLDLPRLSKPSHLPWVVFRCKACHKRFRFDEALSHPHLYKERDMSNLSEYEKLVLGHNSFPRDISVLRVDVVGSQRVENLIRRMGQNPNRATYNGLRRSTIKVVCSLCRPKVATRMDFEHAVEHCLSKHPGKKETEVWTRVSGRKEKSAVPSHTESSTVV